MRSACFPDAQTPKTDGYRRPQSNLLDWRENLSQGTDLRRWLTLQMPRQERSRWSSTWGSCKSWRWFWQFKTLSILLPQLESKKDLVPQIGDPKNSAPPKESSTRWTSAGKFGKVLSPEGQKTSHLLKLRCKPCEGPIEDNCSKRAAREARGPTKVPSSKYQIWRQRSGNEAKSSRRFRTTSEKSKGPRGSPCWTPLDDLMEALPKRNSPSQYIYIVKFSFD